MRDEPFVFRFVGQEGDLSGQKRPTVAPSGAPKREKAIFVPSVCPNWRASRLFSVQKRPSAEGWPKIEVDPGAALTGNARLNLLMF